MKTNRLLSAILLFGMLMVGATCFAQVNNWNIRYIGENKFVVEREDDRYEEIVHLIILPISDLARTGEITKTFHSGEKTLVFNFSPKFNSINKVDRFHLAPRQSLIQLVDIGGMELATKIHTWPEYPDIKYNPIVAPDVYQRVFDIPLLPADSIIKVTDESVWKTRCFFDIENGLKQWFDLDYLEATYTAELRMDITFEAKETDDGYQYLQISPGTDDKYDEEHPVGSGNPGFANKAFYKAGFEHKHGSKNTDWQPYCFPVKSQPDSSGVVPNAWSDLGNPVGQLSQQYFTHNYTYKKEGYSSPFTYKMRANDGRLILHPKLISDGLYLRFDASGSLNDTWNMRNPVAHIEMIDTIAPYLKSINVQGKPHHDCIEINLGWRYWWETEYEDGVSFLNSVCLNMIFNEIVVIEGEDPRIECQESTFNYIGGSGTNVLTFHGQIVGEGNFGGDCVLKNTIIKDLAGNEFVIKTLIPHIPYMGLGKNEKYSIKYKLHGGAFPKDANIWSSYTCLETYTLKQPTRTGCTFLGWSGSGVEGITPTVKIPKHSYGNRHYEAHWQDHWGVDNGADGTADHPYLISDVEGLLLLETFRDDIKDKYFRLEADIDLTGVGFNGISKFYGHLDGNGHVIRGLRIIIEENSFLGLFGVIDDKGGISNLIVDDAIVKGSWDVGVLTGDLWSDAGVQNCLVMNSRIYGDRYVGIVGDCNKDKLDNITNNYYLNCVVNDSIVDNIGLGNVDDAGHFTKLDKDSLEVFYNNGENHPRIEELLAANQSAQAQTRALGRGGRLKAYFAGRKMHRDDMWNTFCIPFDIRDINAKDNEGRYVWPIHGADLRELVDATIDNGKLTLTFSDTLSSIEAGKPYFIKWTKGDEICNPFFEKITITNADPIPFINADSTVVLMGDYDAMDINYRNENIVMVLRDNAISYADSDEKLGAFRCRLFVMPDEEGEKSVSEVVINALPTGIKEVQEATTLHIAKAKKVFRDGKLYIILPNGTCFDATGKQVNL